MHFVKVCSHLELFFSGELRAVVIRLVSSLTLILLDTAIHVHYIHAPDVSMYHITGNKIGNLFPV